MNIDNDKTKTEAKKIVSKLTEGKNGLDVKDVNKLEKDIEDALFLQSILKLF